MAGSEENYSCDLESERVKILMTTSIHSVVVYLICQHKTNRAFVIYTTYMYNAFYYYSAKLC